MIYKADLTRTLVTQPVQGLLIFVPHACIHDSTLSYIPRQAAWSMKGLMTFLQSLSSMLSKAAKALKRSGLLCLAGNSTFFPAEHRIISKLLDLYDSKRGCPGFCGSSSSKLCT